MIEALQPGDMILQFKGNIIGKQLDLSELNPDGSKEYNLSFKVTGSTKEEIQAYIKLLNKDESNDPQNYLAGKHLNIDITTSDLKCEVFIQDPKVAQLREKTNCLTKDLVNGLYRCQGNSIVNNFTKDDYITSVDRTDTVKNNYICLGSDCSTEESNDMYRIIGINDEGEIKVIKNIPEKTQIWDGRLESGVYIEWPDSDIYYYLNQTFYENLPDKLKEKIANATWNYYDIISPEYSYSQNIFTSEEYKKYSELNNAIRYESELNDNSKREKIKEVSKIISEAILKTDTILADNINANVGLMSLVDYCSSFENNGMYNCMMSDYYYYLSEIENTDFGISWLTSKNYSDEWTLSGSGISEAFYTVWTIEFFGRFVSHQAETPHNIRPSFFLTSDIKLTGEGTIEKPFRVTGIE